MLQPAINTEKLLSSHNQKVAQSNVDCIIPMKLDDHVLLDTEQVVNRDHLANIFYFGFFTIQKDSLKMVRAVVVVKIAQASFAF